jgi:hypothetical protein
MVDKSIDPLESIIATTRPASVLKRDEIPTGASKHASEALLPSVERVNAPSYLLTRMTHRGSLFGTAIVWTKAPLVVISSINRAVELLTANEEPV